MRRHMHIAEERTFDIEGALYMPALGFVKYHVRFPSMAFQSAGL